jgi:hypothetical protein
MSFSFALLAQRARGGLVANETNFARRGIKISQSEHGEAGLPRRIHACIKVDNLLTAMVF